MNLTINHSEGQSYLWFLEDVDFNTYEKLRMMYPRFYDQVLEIQEILKAQGMILDDLKIAFEIVLNNMFISCMDENTVENLESFLGIVNSENSKLEDRKLELQNHYRGYGKISKSEISRIANQYNLDTDFSFKERDSEGNFLLRIKLKVINETGKTSNFEETIKVLNVRLPAHLKRFYDIVFSSNSSVGLAQITVGYFKISNIMDLSTEKYVDVFVDENGDVLTDENGDTLTDEEV